MSQIQTNKQQSTEGVPSIRNPREGYLGRMLLSVIISSILLFLLLLGFNTSLDAVMPSAIVWCYKLLNDIVSFLFVTSNQSGANVYNEKTLFIAFLFLLFAGLGIKHYIGKWALWLCSRDPEKGLFYSWIPNFLYHEYATERYKLANKEEEIAALQKKNLELEAENQSHIFLLAEMKRSVRDSQRDRRLVLNLDHLVGKCYIMAAKTFTQRDYEPYRLKVFLNSICAEICSTTMDSNNNKHAYIFLHNAQDDTMTLVGECRSGSSIDSNLKFSKGEGFVGRVWEAGKKMLYTDIANQASDIIVKTSERRYNSIAGVPIVHQDQLIGVVVVASQQAGEISEADYDNIERYLNLVQLALLIELSYLIPKGGDEHGILQELLSKKEPF